MEELIVTELTERQHLAFQSPVDRSDGVLRLTPHGAPKKKGKWTTILEISNGPDMGWTWMASVSRFRAPGNPYTVKQWKKEWFAEADAILQELLEGVGGKDVDVSAQARSMDIKLVELAGYHLWRSLTPEEEALLTPTKEEN